jgi:choline dehydrogenase-like flavoprotein
MTATNTWDVIVVGTGVGGATAGWALARRGLRVLFCDKGKARGAASVVGAYPERTMPRALSAADYTARLRDAGRFLDTIRDASGRKSRDFTPILGSGVGGSSAIYGMVMERFFPSDFTPAEHSPQPEGCNRVERWPIGYDELAPYYVTAEQLYRVRGTLDPLRPHEPRGLVGAPPELSPAGAAHHSILSAAGLHPYRLPQACEFVPGCPGCQGYLCGKECKNDSWRICVAPAVAQHGAEVLDECEVLRLETRGREVSGVVCRRGDQELTLRAPIVLLGAGAFATPLLLLRSASPAWPDGLANGSGMVGRNFMRHHVDLWVVYGAAGPKEPYHENRMLPGSDGAAYQLAYRVRPLEKERVRLFRKLMKRSLRGYRTMVIEQAADNRVLGHVCGTCRFGDDPARHVLDRNNKAHELDNLWVLDGSFLPSSAGTNPSLTLAANALRVAETIVAGRGAAA